MLRRFFKAVTILSSLLCVISSIAWISSIGRFDSVALRREEVPGANVFVFRNSITFWVYSGSGFFQAGVDSWRYSTETARPSHWSWLISHNRSVIDARSAWTLSGFWRGGPWQKAWRTSIEFSYAFAVLGFVIPPVIAWLIKRRRSRLRAQGVCLNCGYDLRATPDRCPECGEFSARTSR